MNDSMKQDALNWLDMQRDAVNTEIVYALQSEQKQYHDHLKIINWLADAARIHGGEMTAVEYLEAHREMCTFYIKDGFGSCDGCPLDQTVPICGHLEEENPSRAIEIVKKWKEEQDG